MVLARVMVLACVMVLARVMVLAHVIVLAPVMVLGVTGSPKMDVFLENSQTALTPPPPYFWKLHCAFFCENL